MSPRPNGRLLSHPVSNGFVGLEPPPAPEIDEVLDRLLDAAESCFDSYGVERTTMSQVAEAAGLSRAFVYKRLGSRESLIRVVLLRRARQFTRRAAAYLASRSSLEDALVEGILLAVGLASRDPYFGVMVNAATMDPDKAITGSAQDALQLTDELWRPIFEAARERGELRDEVEISDLVLWVMHLELTLLSARRTFGVGEEDQERQLRTLLVPAVSTLAT